MKPKVLLLFFIIQLLAGLCAVDAQMGAIQSPATYSFAEDSAKAITDTVNLFTIKDIIITGNRITKPYIVLRETPFKKGDRFPLNVLVNKFADAKKQLMNVGLFRNVIVSMQSLQGFDASVHIEVEERWYLYPLPFFRIVDRSFGEWVEENHMSLQRVNYGIRMVDNNITGRNDKLYFNIMNGYTKQLGVTYEGLYLDNKLQWSANMGASMGKNRELYYATVNNKLVPLKISDEYIHSFARAYVEFSYRRAIKTKHTFSIAYNYEKAADTVFKLNPYFANRMPVITYPEFAYRMDYFNTDFNPYPTNGYVAQIIVNKKGFNKEMNLWQLVAKGSAYWPLTKNTFFNLSAVGGIKLPYQQPYITQQFIGYNDLFLQGYEYYVIDGAAGGYTKATFSTQIMNKAFRVPDTKYNKRLELPTLMPVRIYAKIYGNAGYVYNPQPGDNLLCNKLLFSGGVGFDIIAAYDFIIKIEWSFNQLGQNGLYLHRKSYF